MFDTECWDAAVKLAISGIIMFVIGLAICSADDDAPVRRVGIGKPMLIAGAVQVLPWVFLLWLKVLLGMQT